MSDKTRIAELEHQVADLQAEIAALNLLLPGSKPAPPREERQVRIGPPPLPRLALPNEQQFDQLLGIVWRHHPVLRPREDEADFRMQFKAAFAFLMHCGRREKSRH